MLGRILAGWFTVFRVVLVAGYASSQICGQAR